MNHTQRWQSVCPQLRRVQEKARANPKERFTSLAHLLTVERLRKSYGRIDPSSAPGEDGVTKKDYGENLENNLKELHRKLKEGKYRAKPVLRVRIEKPEGGERLLGLPTTEDKIVQVAVVEILNSVYEADFYGFSYGYRPGRQAHQALRALQTALQKGKVNWVLDADISKFFDTIDHKELMAVIQRRVIDPSLLRLIGKWLAVGVVEEDGRRTRGKQGTPQGGVISPLLANIFLHEVVDKHIHEWRKRKAKGEVYIVRYADDVVMAFEHEEDARELVNELNERLKEYKLALNERKTKLIRFGRKWGGPGSGTFDFLGFTHIVGMDCQGRYLVKRKTSRKRLNRSLKSFHQWCKRNRHGPIGWQHRELSRKLIGHYNYFGIRGNFAALRTVRHKVLKQWLIMLRKRIQRSNISRLYRLLTETFVLPHPKITHSEGWFSSYPGDLLRRAGCGNAARPVL